MKKIILKIVSTVVLLTCFTNTFANVWVSSHPAVGMDTTKLFSGKIVDVFYVKVSASSDISVRLVDENNQVLSIEFDGTDLPVGAAFLPMVGKNLNVTFSDSNFKIGRMFVSMLDI